MTFKLPSGSGLLNSATQTASNLGGLVSGGSNLLSTLGNVSNGGVPQSSTNGLDGTNDSTQALANASAQYTQEQSAFEIQKMGTDTKNAENAGVMDTATKAQNAEITAGKAIQY
ncbi:hypothetical protein [Pseudomonas fluorescens]|nr:hypothetical protein [Pseudomonas fluorescens]